MEEDENVCLMMAFTRGNTFENWNASKMKRISKWKQSFYSRFDIQIHFNRSQIKELTIYQMYTNRFLVKTEVITFMQLAFTMNRMKHFNRIICTSFKITHKSKASRNTQQQNYLLWNPLKVKAFNICHFGIGFETLDNCAKTNNMSTKSKVHTQKYHTKL